MSHCIVALILEVLRHTFATLLPSRCRPFDFCLTHLPSTLIPVPQGETRNPSPGCTPASDHSSDRGCTPGKDEVGALSLLIRLPALAARWRCAAVPGLPGEHAPHAAVQHHPSFAE